MVNIQVVVDIGLIVEGVDIELYVFGNDVDILDHIRWNRIEAILGDN